MKTQIPFNRLILRAALRKVSPMVIRLLAVPDYLDLASFDEFFRTVLGWDGLGFSFLWLFSASGSEPPVAFFVRAKT
jgi:hypothetical protein